MHRNAKDGTLYDLISHADLFSVQDHQCYHCLSRPGESPEGSQNTTRPVDDHLITLWEAGYALKRISTCL